jgi:drug/metabolite transporter (DMT)-like permease
MQLLLSFVVGVLLVTGQALWKLAMGGALKAGGDFSAILRSPLQILLNPVFLLGCMIYIVATVLYMYVISKYNYGISYAMIVACSTILASVLANTLFKEQLTLVNVAGLLLVVGGVALLVRK